MNKYISNLIQVFSSKEQMVSGPKIKVESMMSKVAFAYEKVRNAVDYKEDNLLRISALERMLKRRVQSKQSPSAISQALIEELIRAKYLPNDELSENLIKDVADIINKYTRLKEETNKKHKKVSLSSTFEWLDEIAAREIDEALVPTFRNKALIDAFFHTVEGDIVFQFDLPKEERQVQMYIASNKAFLKWDQVTIEYLLIRYYYPHWFFSYEEVLDDMSSHLLDIKYTVTQLYNNALNERLSKHMKPHVVVFDIIQEILHDKGEQSKEIFEDDRKLERTVEQYTKKKYEISKKKLRRSVFNAVIYILITKSILAFFVETPIDLLFQNHINTFALLFNILVPPLLMFIFAMRIKVPKDENTEKVVEYTKDIVKDQENESLKQYIKKPKKRSLITTVIFWMLYLALYTITFGFIYYLLNTYLNFNALSIALFIFFLSLVVFFLIRISKTARELSVIKKKEGFFSFLFSLFILPIVRFGHWLSRSLGKINIFIFVMDFIIETPFKKLIEFFEDWIRFVKEKKDEIY